MKPVLVVGAGFAGAVYARTLADHGIDVHVIDRRPHIGGNAYDEVMPNGTRIHRYGPHLFHTNMKHVVDWMKRFGSFVPYEHRVQALLDNGQCVPLPINRATVNAIFNVSLASGEEMCSFLQKQSIPCEAPRNAAEYLYAQIGKQLTDLFFRPYTRKMWEMDLEDLDAAVVKRIPICYGDDDRYFPDDTYQILPEHGYTAVFQNILDHPRITVTLDTPFGRGFCKDYSHCFNSMAIDEYFNETLGQLPYRSLHFHHREETETYKCGEAPIINFTDDRPYTRQTDWSRMPCHAARNTLRTLTLEQPCDYRDNGHERYYPVKTSDGRFEALYQRYCALAEKEPHMTFIGRCGTYRYLDMHQVINQSLKGAEMWLENNRLKQATG